MNLNITNPIVNIPLADITSELPMDSINQTCEFIAKNTKGIKRHRSEHSDNNLLNLDLSSRLTKIKNTNPLLMDDKESSQITKKPKKTASSVTTHTYKKCPYPMTKYTFKHQCKVKSLKSKNKEKQQLKKQSKIKNDSINIIVNHDDNIGKSLFSKSSDEEVCKSLTQHSPISAVKPSCTYNIFRLWFGAEGIKNDMLWANLIQDKRLNPSSNVHLIIDSEDHSEITNKNINDLSKEFGIHLLDINYPINSDNTILHSELIEKIKQRKNDKKTCYKTQKDFVQLYLCSTVPYCAIFDIDTRLLKPIEEIVSQREKRYNDRGELKLEEIDEGMIECEHEFHKIIVRMTENHPIGRDYLTTDDMNLDAFINARKDLISYSNTPPLSDASTLYGIESYPCLHINYIKNKSTAFNCFDTDCDILTVPMDISTQCKGEVYAKNLSICDREVYEQQKELVKESLIKSV